MTENNDGELMRLTTGKISVSKVFIDHLIIGSDENVEYKNIYDRKFLPFY